MYGAKATSTIINTVARQGVLTKQLTAPKSAAFLTQLPTRHVSAGKISYTTTSRSTHFSQKSVQHNQENQQQQQQQLDESLILQGQLRTAWKHKRPPLTDPAQVDGRILQAAKENDLHTVISTFTQGKSLSGAPLSSQTYEAVIEAYGKLRRQNQPLTPMMDAYRQMIASGARPSSHTYALLIRSLCTRDSEVQKTVGMLRRQMARTGNAVDNLSDLENEKNMEQALDLFEKAVKEKCTQDFDVDLYNRMLQNLSFKGNTERGIYILKHLEGDGNAKPNGVTFATLLSLFGVAGDLPAVRECFLEYKSLERELPSHDPAYVYNALVSAYVNAGDLDGALNIVQNVMTNDGIKVSIVPYNKIFRRACVDNKLDLVESILAALENDSKLPKPNGSTYAVVLSAYARKKDFDKAAQVYSKLLKCDISKEYGHLADYAYACIGNNKPEIAIQVVQDMVTHGLRLDLTLCQKLFASFVNNGKLEDAISSYQKTMDAYAQTHFVDKSSPIASLGLELALKCTNLKQALEVLEILKKYSVGPNPVVSSTIYNMYKKAKSNSTEWETISKDLSPLSFTVLYDAIFRKQSIPDDFCKTAFELLEDMLSLGISPTPSLYIRVLARMQKYGVPAEYEERWNRLFGPYIPPLPENINSQQDTESSNTSDNMNNSTQESSTNKIEPINKVTVESEMLSGKALSKALEGKYDEAIDILQNQIIQKGHIPSPDVIRDIIQVCTKYKDLGAINKIYSTVIESVQKLEHHTRQRGLHTIYNAMLVSNARLSSIDQAKAFYSKIRDLNMYPTGDAYGCLLQHLQPNDSEDSMDNLAADAMTIYEEAKKNKVEPTVYMYNVILSKLAKAQRLDSVLTLFNEMRQVGIVPNSVTYGSVISACVRCQNEELAVKYFNEMTVSPGYKPRAGPFTLMIQFYMQNQNREMALYYYNLAKQQRLNISDQVHGMFQQEMSQ
ncbi:hypothetical protein G6F70_005325 [Rhizopus microsporus]|uniref:Pentatricopeptide repeat-containing protein-mitochondrial domain-containing protein n=1 Tax=Rhizopus azygosporus TaxID=86630 RepID=A0A367JVI7_RHIAZ|nr:hypothetical protein G6F71_005220 [Rhizopus microsporus]RCH93953.1 hypothetical protein CU097_005415 [Rhizopus azygosporus]KAG1198994.1 hypothetical protein G6F70_005325 [Rhizopus microsporus]KAG1210756.1 hypothetical protein G6F69_005209 [Rhizopus microsporus]KAG1232576.1 hypothetical protein G6F67_004923 [Rhizopus microsporus]